MASTAPKARAPMTRVSSMEGVVEAEMATVLRANVKMDILEIVARSPRAQKARTAV